MSNLFYFADLELGRGVAKPSVLSLTFPTCFHGFHPER